MKIDILDFLESDEYKDLIHKQIQDSLIYGRSEISTDDIENVYKKWLYDKQLGEILEEKN